MAETNAEFVKNQREQCATNMDLSNYGKSKSADYLARKLLDACDLLEQADEKLAIYYNIFGGRKATDNIVELRAKIEQLEIRLKESRKLGNGHKDRELANVKNCNEYYEQIKQLQSRVIFYRAMRAIAEEMIE